MGCQDVSFMYLRHVYIINYWLSITFLRIILTLTVCYHDLILCDTDSQKNFFSELYTEYTCLEINFKFCWIVWYSTYFWYMFNAWILHLLLSFILWGRLGVLTPKGQLWMGELLRFEAYILKTSRYNCTLLFFIYQTCLTHLRWILTRYITADCVVMHDTTFVPK